MQNTPTPPVSAWPAKNPDKLRPGILRNARVHDIYYGHARREYSPPPSHLIPFPAAASLVVIAKVVSTTNVGGIRREVN